MAFNVLAKLENYEVRNVQPRTFKNGRSARFIRLESPDAAFTCEVACWDDSLFKDVDVLMKGDRCDWLVRCSAGDFEGISLVSVTPLSASSDDGYGY